MPKDLTVKDLKELLKRVKDDTLICIYDEDGDVILVRHITEEIVRHPKSEVGGENVLIFS